MKHELILDWVERERGWQCVCVEESRDNLWIRQAKQRQCHKQPYRFWGVECSLSNAQSTYWITLQWIIKETMLLLNPKEIEIHNHWISLSVSSKPILGAHVGKTDLNLTCNMSCFHFMSCSQARAISIAILFLYHIRNSILTSSVIAKGLFTCTCGTFPNKPATILCHKRLISIANVLHKT